VEELIWHPQFKKRNCGQIAVAVVTGKPVHEIEAFLGHDIGTKTRDIAKALNHYGFSCPSRLKPMKNKPEFAIAKLMHPLRKGWHWVVIHNDKVYDGAWGHPDGTVKWLRGYRITSYLPIERIK